MRLAAIGIAGVVACAVILAVAIDSVGGHHRDLITIFGPVIGAAFIGTGLLAWLRRPENRFGALMVALGFSYCLSALIVTTQPWTFIAGLLVIALPYAILYHILLAFPSGRLETRGNRALAGAAYLAATAGWWTCMLFQDPTRQGLPSNPLMIADEPDLFSALARIRLAIVAVLIVLLGVVLVRRFTASTPTQRRALAPVYVSGGLVLLLYAVWAVLGVARADPDLQETLEYARVVALAAVPFAFLAGLLRSRVAAAGAVNELVARLGAGRGHEGLRDALADALGDPTLRLAYWLPERGDWVTAQGVSFALPDADADRTCTPSSATGSPWRCSSTRRRWARSRISCGPSAERLRSRWRTSGWTRSFARASRSCAHRGSASSRAPTPRAAGSSATCTMAHSSSSSPWRSRLRRARSHLDRDPDAAGVLLDTAMSDLDSAMRELRELARGIHPAVLSDHGLGAALEALAQRVPLAGRDDVASSGPPARAGGGGRLLRGRRGAHERHPVRERKRCPGRGRHERRSDRRAGHRRRDRRSRPGEGQRPARPRRPGRRAGRPARGRLGGGPGDDGPCPHPLAYSSRPDAGRRSTRPRGASTRSTRTAIGSPRRMTA